MAVCVAVSSKKKSDKIVVFTVVFIKFNGDCNGNNFFDAFFIQFNNGCNSNKFSWQWFFIQFCGGFYGKNNLATVI